MFQLQAAVGPEIAKNELLAQFAHLLKDTEAEVRCVAAGKIKGALCYFVCLWLRLG